MPVSSSKPLGRLVVCLWIFNIMVGIVIMVLRNDVIHWALRS
jgi:hypothetical protein